MKVIFMGTPDFAVKTLEACMKHHEVVAVFTQPDKPKGRGKQMAKPPVKEVAQANGIPVFQPERIKKGDWTEQIKAIAPDVIVVVAYGQILSKELLEIPKFGCVNVHASLLPKYRGAAPINWAIVHGETESGVTTMLMDVGIDTGDMLLKAKVDIGPDMIAQELHDKLSKVGADLLIETLDQLGKGILKPEQQKDYLSSHAGMLNKELSKIDWTKTAFEIHNQIRGFNPWPVAYTYYQDQVFKIFKSHPIRTLDLSEVEAACLKMINEEQVVGGSVGYIIGVRKHSILVMTGDGVLELLEVQYGNSKRMSAGAFLLGHSLKIGSYFGKNTN